MVVALDVQNLTKELGRKLILDNVSFKIEKGEIFGIIGMSGSGKSTLLHHLIGYYAPNEGKVMYCPNYTEHSKTGPLLKNVQRNLMEVKKLFGFAPQNPSFYPRLTVEENILHFGSLYHLKRKNIKERMNYLLHLTELEPHRKKLAEHLSGGMQRRLSLVCSLIHKPEVLILDEPTEDLDPILREEMWQLIKSVNKQENSTIIIASHLLEELEKYCDKVAILHEGKISRSGSLDDIKDMYAKDDIEIHVDLKKGSPNTLLDQLDKKAISKVQHEGQKLIIHTLQPFTLLAEVINFLKRNREFQCRNLEVHRPSLKEVFELLEKK